MCVCVCICTYVCVYIHIFEKEKETINEYLINRTPYFFVMSCTFLFLEMTSLQWWHKLFWTLISLTRRPVSNYPYSKHYCENPRTQGWGWSILMDHRDYKGLHWKGKSGYTLTTLAFLQTGTTPHTQKNPPGPIVSLVVKRYSRWTSTS